MQVSRPQVHSASGHLCRACIRMMGTAGAKLVLRLFTFAAKSGMLWNAGGPGQRTQQPHTAPQLRAWRPAAPTYSKHTGRQRGWSRTKSCARAWRHAPPRRTPTPALHSTSHHGPRCTPTPALQNPPRTPAHAHSSHALLTTNTWAQRLGLAEHPGARSGTYLALAGPCPGPRQYPP